MQEEVSDAKNRKCRTEDEGISKAHRAVTEKKERVQNLLVFLNIYSKEKKKGNAKEGRERGE